MADFGFVPMAGGGIDIGSGGGQHYLVGTNNHIYQFNDCTENWDKIASTPLAERIDVDGNGIPWIIATDNTIHRWDGNAFAQISGTGIDIGINGVHIGMIGMDGNIYYRINDNWTSLPYSHVPMTRIDMTNTGYARTIGEDGVNYWDQGGGVYGKGSLIGIDVSVPETTSDHHILSEDIPEPT